MTRTTVLYRHRVEALLSGSGNSRSSVISLNRLINNDSACAMVSFKAPFTLRSMRQSGRSERLPIAKRLGRPKAEYTSSRLISASERASVQPPPCPFSDRT